NPVVMLDEIDKLGAGYQGDPSAALLEVLDPEQNKAFADHYLEVSFDLSKILFIATANTLETVPPALRDRMEVLEIPSYTSEEKAAIARRHLMPKQLEAHGLSGTSVELTDAALDHIIAAHTREAGVRALEKRLADVCRSLAGEKAAGTLVQPPPLHVHVPAGATPKDGPSAGVTLFTALVSLLSGVPVRTDTAMTGEATLRGRVLPVGGIKEKVLAAHRLGLKRVVIPEACAAELREVPQH